MKDSGIEWIGEIPESWNFVSLKTVVSCFGRIGFRGYTQEDLVDKGEGPITLSPTNIIDSKISLNKCSYISWDKYYESPEIMVKRNDIVFVKTASVGKCAIYDSDEEATINPQFVVFKDIKCDTKYLYYVLLSDVVQHPIALSNFGSVIGTITQRQLLSYKICLPNEKEQQAISTYLDCQCAHIDNIIEKTKASIEEYKKLRQAVITQTVTKGVSGDRPMKDSGIEWIGEIPEEWEVYRMGALYSERKEQGNDELPILTVSINTGVSDRELADDETARIFVRSEDRSKYMRVYPGDLTYNMMRAWQGAFGAVRVDGMVSPAYVIAKPKCEIDSRYMEALLRTPAAKEEMKRYSHGIADFRLRLYWEKFKYLKICFPPVNEQKIIADYIDSKCTEIDSLISKKEQFLTELESYKKSMIYEYVTGKKEVPQS